MKPAQERRQNSRQGSNRRPPVQFKQFETSGPAGKFKGAPKQIIEKYLQLARDFSTSGDNIKAETCKQYAEHYLRLLGTGQQPQQQNRDSDDRNNQESKRNNRRTAHNVEEIEIKSTAVDASQQPQPQPEVNIETEVEVTKKAQATSKRAPRAVKKEITTEGEASANKPKRRGRPPKKQEEKI